MIPICRQASDLDSSFREQNSHEAVDTIITSVIILVTTTVLISEYGMARDANISDAEWQVMEAVWSLGAAPAAAIIEELAESTAWNHRTIRTLLTRLVEKGVLEKHGQGAGSVYRALVPRRARVRSEGRSFLKRMFQGDTTSLLVHFAKEAKLGPAKLAQLRKLLDDESGKPNTGSES